MERSRLGHINPPETLATIQLRVDLYRDVSKTMWPEVPTTKESKPGVVLVRARVRGSRCSLSFAKTPADFKNQQDTEGRRNIVTR